MHVFSSMYQVVLSKAMTHNSLHARVLAYATPAGLIISLSARNVYMLRCWTELAMATISRLYCYFVSTIFLTYSSCVPHMNTLSSDCPIYMYLFIYMHPCIEYGK